MGILAKSNADAARKVVAMMECGDPHLEYKAAIKILEMSREVHGPVSTNPGSGSDGKVVIVINAGREIKPDEGI
jgi:hypothetical protein